MSSNKANKRDLPPASNHIDPLLSVYKRYVRSLLLERYAFSVVEMSFEKNLAYP